MELTKNDLEVAGCLRRLLKNRFILRTRNEKWFQTMIDQRSSLQNLFNKMLLRMEINETLGLIYLTPESEELEEKIAYQMHRKKSLSMFSSLITLYLRKLRLQFYMNPNSDEIAVVSLQDLREYLENFNQLKVDMQFERLFRKTLDELLENHLLRATEESSGHFEITPICEVILPADVIYEFEKKISSYFGNHQMEISELKEDADA